ncbi:hypothetical protein AAMO2058_000113500 [Amorphochlora amoebiformis]
MLGRVSTVARKFPVLIGGATLGGRYVIGDLFTQFAVEGENKDTFSSRRTLTFGIFGFIMGSGPLYWWFVKYLPNRFGGLRRPFAIIARSATDCRTLMPFFYFPIFYQVKEFVFWNPKETSIYDLPKRATQKYLNGFMSDLKSTTLVCFPMNLILFSAVPDHFR